MKSILLIGLGRFGRHIAEKLHDMQHAVLAVDHDEDRVNRILPLVTNALIADSTNADFLQSLDIPSFDVCIVAIGDDFQSSLETTSLLKEFGARYVVARASRDIHEKFLLRNGADETVYPERQLALWTAIRCGSNHILDYFPLSDEYAIYEVPVPRAWAGKSIGELDVRRRHHLNILGIKAADRIDLNISAQTILAANAAVLVAGRQEDVDHALRKND
ncbi:potassium channel family protein [Selenomonas sputigena]|jgi:potassium uptake protein ktrA|uniref:TrkA N-terminal domain protein n=1 Tax=Selenomonas sputigena (strain ATCC 35185 / DSM 20758 / CCUG 44933 / VPI D19B-28) TaxID=546271 RepID=C9LRI2_SELS3|nr:TrkA family potassium uptake protein [Selenomonas sputigena]AEC00898.1 TrkA-N domain protein [Selenomonas sputigena ATCC 35185]EEX78448.1 TrkA N-terminal domain protein [Selenomonas sputigena ATCC 35185]